MQKPENSRRHLCQLRRQPATTTGRPRFHRTAKQTAVISFRDVGKISVIIKSLTSTEEREIYVKGLRVGYDLLWHPDGKSLLIRGNDAGFQWGIHRLDLATGRLEEPILKIGENNLGQFEVSPDGGVLYYHPIEPSAKKSALISRNLITGLGCDGAGPPTTPVCRRIYGN
jgi:hypothetical protein